MRRRGAAFPPVAIAATALFLKGKIMEEKINRESAEKEFVKFCGVARINVDRYRNDEDADDFNTYRETFIEGVMEGRILVSDDGWPTVLTESPDLKEVHFPRRPKGFDRCVMDKLPADSANAKLFTWIGSVIGKSHKLLQALEEHDLRLVQHVFFLFRDA